MLLDLVDGAMARARGYGTDFGVVLDASCDRIADGAVFGALAYYAFTTDQPWLGVAALICLVTGQVISYVKARADSVHLKIGGALAERAERNLLGLVGAGLAGLGVPYALDIGLWVLAVAGLVTVVQRLVQVHRAAVQAAAENADRPRHRTAGAVTAGAVTVGTGRRAGASPRRRRRRDLLPPAASGARSRRSRAPGVGWIRAGLVALPSAAGAGRRPAVPAAADLAFRRRGPGVVQFARNLLRVLGDAVDARQRWPRVTRAGVRSYARYWRETFRLPGDGPATRSAAGRGRGTIGARAPRRGAAPRGGAPSWPLPHSGNWDVAGLMIAQRYGGADHRRRAAETASRCTRSSSPTGNRSAWRSCR